MAISPASLSYAARQRYEPETNVLHTLFEVPGEGAARLTDFMPWFDDPHDRIHQVHRRIEGAEGRVRFRVTFDPRFDYGRTVPRHEIGEDGVVARDGSRGLALSVRSDVAGGMSARPEGGTQVEVTVGPGERIWVVYAWASRVDPLRTYRGPESLRSTLRAWRAWSHHVGFHGPWRRHVLRSALVLKLLQFAPTGAMIAAPTTSLPEWIGGARNWDYRYAWIRDAAMSVRAMSRLGPLSEGRSYFRFVRGVLERSAELPIMTAVDGEPVPGEVTLDHLRGYRDSGPVRVGNGARDQLQLDCVGYLLDAADVYERHGGQLSGQAWHHLARAVDRGREKMNQPDHGIWEPREGPRHHVSSKLMTWVALDRGLSLGRRFGDARRAERWRQGRREIRHAIEDAGLDPSKRYFVDAFGGVDIDASLLLFPLCGFLPPDDPRVQRTVRRVQEELGHRGFVYRYRYSDGLAGDEGAFVLCGFWLAEALALSGRLDEALDVFDRHVGASNHLGLLSEEVNPETGEVLGNFPQAFSHHGLIDAAIRLDDALRRRDEEDGDGVADPA